MDFAHALYELSTLVAERVSAVDNEEAVKMALVMPFIQLLGYDVFNPKEVVPEFVCDIGIKKGERIDYAIMADGCPSLLVECKNVCQDLDLHINQLYRYYTTSNARIAILTNGVIYKFFADTERINIMDMTPFYEVDITKINDYDVSQLLKFHKRYFNSDYVCDSIIGVRYVRNQINKLSSAIVLSGQKNESNIKLKEKEIDELRNVVATKDKEIISLKNRVLQFEEAKRAEEERKRQELLAKEQREKELQDDDILELVDYLNMPVPPTWNSFNLQKRREYYKNREKWTGSPRDFLCTSEVACEFYGYNRGESGTRIGKYVANNIRLTQLFVQTGAKKRFGEYGSALAWIRKTKLASIKVTPHKNKGRNR
ncbi:MAG: hypothetical protein E7134_07565 [Rikenellaceae bacterium]|nr:hypothetical protein [Rikenellaceae bacterium]